MNRVLSGGHNVYGIPVGVLMLETQFPRPPGDMGHALTFPYPVLYHVVAGAGVRKVIAGDRRLLPAFIEGACSLEAAGVRIITTNCGFLALFQRELAQAASIPVVTSSLLAVPLVHHSLCAGKKVGILTADASSLGHAHYVAAGWSEREVPIKVVGMENSVAFNYSILDNGLTLDLDQVERDVVAVARELCREGDIGAIVMECTNLPPYEDAVRQETGLPVIHILHVLKMFVDAIETGDYG